MICELCNTEHDGNYGSGRFCSYKCARSFSSKEKRKEINEKVSKKLKNDPKGCGWSKGIKYPRNIYSIECKNCGNIFKRELTSVSFESGKFLPLCNKCRNIKILEKSPVDRIKIIYKATRKANETKRKKEASLSWEEASNPEKYRRVKIEQDNKCFKCGLDKWFGKDIPLEIDHINGNNKDQRRENLRYLCPNCHAQTDTFRAKNIIKKNPDYNGRKVSDKDLIESVISSKNYSQALQKVGLEPKGGNYKRIKNLIEQNLINKNT